ncbi:MAG: hypothetical protein ABIP37_03895, partial [Methylotenera sp.]
MDKPTLLATNHDIQHKMTFRQGLLKQSVYLHIKVLILDLTPKSINTGAFWQISAPTIIYIFDKTY